jgi:hypothetical protein
MPKWVGFDLDECIGSVMPLYVFLIGAKGLGNEREILQQYRKSLFLSEMLKETWLLRPAMYFALRNVYNAYKSGKLYGAFIFSNNGSQELVDFIAYYCNGWMSRYFRDKKHPIIFKMAICRGSSYRPPNSLVKSYDEISNALIMNGLPPFSNKSDLLFFDDLVHVLQGEIDNYVHVRPYNNLCPIDNVINALYGSKALLGDKRWENIVSMARRFFETMKHDGYNLNIPSDEETLQDKEVFRNAFRKFVGKKGGTRRNRQLHSLKTRHKKIVIL